MKISILIPCRNEADNLGFVLDEVETVFSGRDFEIIVIDDGSTDRTSELLRARMAEKGSGLKALAHDASAGKAAALKTGLAAAAGEICATMDGDGQNDPAYLLQLVDALVAAGPTVAVAAGQRLRRTDTRLKQYASRFANKLRQSILKDGTRDTACGLKAVRTEVFRQFPFFDNWHRFLPALACREGYGVVHLDVVDRARMHGNSNYGIFDRGTQGALDLFGVWWLRKRRKVIPTVSDLAS